MDSQSCCAVCQWPHPPLPPAPSDASSSSHQQQQDQQHSREGGHSRGGQPQHDLWVEGDHDLWVCLVCGFIGCGELN
jgi:hypothetical protein